jgi:hypothetical protein
MWWVYAFLTLLTVALIGFAIYVQFFVTSPYPQPSHNGCIDPVTDQPLPNGWQRPNCDYVTENYNDTSIASPLSTMYLGDFYFSEGGASGGFCIPTYYAYRYVRISDGGYGPLSAWSAPIRSGACTLPCYPPPGSTAPQSSWCATDGILVGDQTDSNGYSTLSYNTPVMVVMDAIPLPYSNIDSYVLNVHRYVGLIPPSSTDEGQIVGVMYPLQADENGASPPNGWQGKFIDAAYSVSTPGIVCTPATC